MRTSSIPRYQRALELRLKGNSEGEIKKALGVPKSTLSGWFKNLVLPLKARKLLEEKGRTTRKQLMDFNRRRTLLIKSENKNIKEKSLKDIGQLSERELMLIGTALYWGEGYRIEIQKRSPTISFANSDPNMVVLFLRFLREILKIPEKKIRPRVQIFGNIEAKDAVKFWSRILFISPERFHVYFAISKAGNGKRPKNFLPFGTIQINVCDRMNAFKIQGWINGLAQQTKIKN
ncbi:MAG: hypothetical protein Q8N65_00965 [bacterium]|nr:hypothetical protein [bacterium]